jgi:hypothetical protein
VHIDFDYKEKKNYYNLKCSNKFKKRQTVITLGFFSQSPIVDSYVQSIAFD